MNDARPKSVLIVCTGNSCRSQMAEAIWRHEAGDRFDVASAGTFPSGVHPLARQVIEELGIDMSGQSSKSVFAISERDWDLVITVCDDAKEVCPVFQRAKRQLHWPFFDPVSTTGPPEQRLPAFRRTRDEIRGKILEFLESIKAVRGADGPA